MADTARKKVIELDSRGSLGGSESDEGMPLGGDSASAFPGFGDFEEAQETKTTGGQYSLDEFNPEVPKRVELPEPEAAPAPSVPEPRKSGRNYLELLKNRRVQAFAASVLLVIVGTVFVLLRMGDDDPGKPIVTMVRQAISMPVVHEKLEFVVFSRAREERGMVVLTLELEFRNPEKHRRFRMEDVLCRDIVYRFLDAQRPSKNSLKEWQPIVQKDLLNFLRENLPQAAADQVRMDRLERL